MVIQYLQAGQVVRVALCLALGLFVAPGILLGMARVVLRVDGVSYARCFLVALSGGFVAILFASFPSLIVLRIGTPRMLEMAGGLVSLLGAILVVATSLSCVAYAGLARWLPRVSFRRALLATVIPLSAQLISGGAILDALTPTIHAARALARIPTCRENLASIGVSISMYNAQYKAFPSSLELVAKYPGATSVRLTCPASTEGSGYFYLAPSDPVDERQLIASDRPGNHKDDGFTVLLGNGQASSMTEQEFHKELTLGRNNAFAEALKKAQRKIP